MEKQMTVNGLMVVMKAVRTRINELTALCKDNSTERDWFSGGQTSKIEKPQYDVKKLDAQRAGLEKFLFKADLALKESNAVTKVSIEADLDVLLAPIT